MYHINEAGNPGFCKATRGNCPFGNVQDHFTSKEAARNAFEEKMNSDGHKQFVQRNIEIIKSATLDTDFSNPKYWDYAQAEKSIDRMLDSAELKAAPELREAVRELGSKLSIARYSEGSIHEDRVAKILHSQDNRSMSEVLSSGAVTKDSIPARLTDAEVRGVRVVGMISGEGKKSFYELPVSYIGALASTHPIKSHPTSNVETLVKIAAIVRKADPDFTPDARYTPPNRVAGYQDATHIPQMQNVSPKTYSLLKRYVDGKYGERNTEFWDTVQSNSPNYPKISDFVREEKAFDKS